MQACLFSLDYLLLGKPAAMSCGSHMERARLVSLEQTLSPNQTAFKITAAPITTLTAVLWDILSQNHPAKLFSNSRSTGRKRRDNTCYFCLKLGNTGVNDNWYSIWQRKDLSPGSWGYTLLYRSPQHEDTKLFVSQVAKWRNIHVMIKQVCPPYNLHKYYDFSSI